MKHYTVYVAPNVHDKLHAKRRGVWHCVLDEKMTSRQLKKAIVRHSRYSLRVYHHGFYPRLVHESYR